MILALPLVSLSAYTLIGAGVAFGVVRWAKTAENATDYSVMNTGRQMLWLPTRREEKYKAKQALDTFFVRTGDMIAGGLVFAGTTWLALGVRGFAWGNVALAAALARWWRSWWCARTGAWWRARRSARRPEDQKLKPALR